MILVLIIILLWGVIGGYDNIFDMFMNIFILENI